MSAETRGSMAGFFGKGFALTGLLSLRFLSFPCRFKNARSPLSFLPFKVASRVGWRFRKTRPDSAVIICYKIIAPYGTC